MIRTHNSVSNQIKYGSIISYILIILNIALGLIYTPWILHEVGSSNYGLYTLASSLIALFLMDFGMSAAVTRFISNYRAEGKQEAINSFVGLSIKFYVIICSVIALLLIIIYFNIGTLYANLTADEIPIFKVVFIITSVFLVICFPVNICNGILNAYEQFVWLKGSEIINRLGIVIFTIIALLLHGGIYALVFITGFFNFLTFVLKTILVKKHTPVCPSFKRTNEISIKEIFAFSAWSTVNGLSQQLIFNIIPSILAGIANTMAITLYGFANVIEGYVSNITSAINGLFMPKVSRIVIKKEDAEDVLPLMIKVGRINQSIVTILLIGLTALGQEFVRLWVGNEYNALYPCILFLSFPYFVSASQQIGNTSITVLNKVKYSALIRACAGILNVILCIVLCPRYGVVGVCAGTGIAFVLQIICLNFVYKRMLKINIFEFFKECHLKMMPGIVLSTVLSILLVHFIPNSLEGFKGWAILGGRALLILGIYLICMWLFSWNSYEKSLFKSFLHSRKRSLIN